MTSIQKRPNGKFRARYRDETGYERSKHFATRRQAREFLNEVTSAIVTGTYVDPSAGRMTFDEYFASWLPIKSYETTTRSGVILAATDTPFGSVRMHSIKPRHIEAWVTDMYRRRGLAPGTVRTRVGYVRGVFRSAVADRVIREDPTTRVKLPPAPKTRQLRALPTPAQVGDLMPAADADFAVYIALAAFGGLRLGEVSGIQVADIDFLGRVLRVRRQVQRASGGQVEIRAPKAGSARDVSLTDGLLELVAAMLARNGLPGPSERFLFGDATGVPPHQNTVGHRWRRVLKVAGLEGIRFHDLRHFYASGLIASGCDVVTVQAALGHSNPKITLDTYSHLFPTAADRTRDAAAGLLAQAMGDSTRESDLRLS